MSNDETESTGHFKDHAVYGHTDFGSVPVGFVAPRPWKETLPTMEEWNQACDEIQRVLAEKHELQGQLDDSKSAYNSACIEGEELLAEVSSLEKQLRESAMDWLATSRQADEALAQVRRLRDSSRALQDYIESNPDAVTDIPDAVYVPFIEAIKAAEVAR